MGRRGLLAATIACLLLGGCGGGSGGEVPTFAGTDEEQIAGTVNAMTGAIAAGDGELACGLMSEQGRAIMLDAGRQAGGEEVGDCESAVPAAEAMGFDPGDFRVEVGDVSVGGDAATVRCDIDGEFALVREDAGWRVDVPYCNH
ncbi:MAG: hypothetical protein R2718_00645 [Solirubrobacterales bacterium]|nr:hypothetical protein [Solirubrobacterales bacterium]